MRVPIREPIENRILRCQSRPVLPAADLARFLGVSNRALLTCMQRHGPPPGEFAFVANPYDPPAYRDDAPTAKPAHVFTEHGALAAAYLIGTNPVVARGIEILRAFVRFRLGNGEEIAPEIHGPRGSPPTRAGS